jgi:glycyl-tRNA synthetase beta chain
VAEARDLLVEIGTEELPPTALFGLSRAFTEGVLEGLRRAELTPGSVHNYATPRRLAILCEGVPDAQQDREVGRRGPALQAAFDAQGRATKAAEGFARSCGVEVAALETLETDKGSWLSYRVLERGKPAAELLAGIIEEALRKLPVPKRMRWGDSDQEFVRPVHWVVLLFGEQPIEAEILGVGAGRETRGHRFLHPKPLFITSPSEYAPMLETQGRVLADFATRRAAIRGQVEEAAVSVGGRALIDASLLDEVTALVEWPVAMVCSFEQEFLEVPAEALVSTMQGNQKYFPVVDDAGALLPHFVTVSNIESRDPAKVREGNERVIRPRFADARFFWDQDRRHPLSARIAELKEIVFEQQLGTLFDKSERVERLAGLIAEQTGADRAEAMRAAQLSKCDLMTSMVYEFPELQGTMGRYYALNDGETKAVAQALEEQYLPRHAGDALPSGAVGQVLAIADRLDTLAGIFAIGQRPTGTKDPYGLRRAALGVLRIMIEKGLDLDLEALLVTSNDALRDRVNNPPAAGEAFDYAMERLDAYFQDQGIGADVIAAVMAQRPTRPLDFRARVEAVERFRRLPEAESLAAANKRIANILRQVDGELPISVSGDLLVEPAERALNDAVAAVRPEVEGRFDRGDYEPALERLAALRETVDRFFDEVMVMTDDDAVRHNRLALLNLLRGLFLRAADLSRLQPLQGEG